MSDHGISADARIATGEVQHKVAHLTWNRFKAEYLKNHYGVETYLIPHPWIYWRNHHGYVNQPKQVVAFMPHSINEIGMDVDDQDEYVTQLTDEFGHRNVLLCFQQHDILNGKYRKWLDRGFRMTSAGSSLHPSFVERFHAILSSASVVTSPSIGSHIFFALSARIPCRMLGQARATPDPNSIYRDGLNRPAKFGIDAACPGNDDAIEQHLRSDDWRSFEPIDTLVIDAMGSNQFVNEQQMRKILRTGLKKAHRKFLPS